MPGVLDELSEFVAGSRWELLPSGVRERARIRLLDTVMVALIGRSSAGVEKVRRLVCAGETGAGRASHWLTGQTGPAEACAFTNSIAIHAITHEDGGPGGHPSANVTPSAFAAGELVGGGGRDLLLGIAIGYEVQARIGTPELYRQLASRGHRGTIVPGAFGAAAAAVPALGLGGEEARNALAFAASVCAPGIEQPVLAAKSDERWIQLASNTRNGLTSALLARAGYTGSERALDGDSGFFETYLGRAGDQPGVADDLGSSWLSDRNTTRPYPTGGWNIGPIYATLKLVGEHGLRPEQVERVEVLHTWWSRNTAYIHPGPFETTEQTLLSCPFAVACCIVRGGADWDTVRSAFADPEVADLARRVEVEGVATWGLHDGEVTVVTKDGRRLHADARDLPSALVRPTWPEAVAKLHELAGSVPADHREAIVEAIGEVEEQGGLRRLAELLRQPVEDPHLAGVL